MLFIPQSNDERLIYLAKLFEDKITTLEKADCVVIPELGVDSYGIIKGTNISILNLLKQDIKAIFYFQLNANLKELILKKGIKLYSFYEDLQYVKDACNLKWEIIKHFACEKTKKCIKDITYLSSKDSIEKDDYDIYIHYDGPRKQIKKDAIYIEMNNELQPEMPIYKKNFYWIMLLTNQYLTKSGAKYMYDSMVRKGVNL